MSIEFSSYSFEYCGQHIIINHLDPNDYIFQEIKRSGFFELSLLEAIKKRTNISSGSVVIDAGSNIGNHTIYFSKMLDSPEILSIEANDLIFFNLCKNVQANRLPKVNLVNAILGRTVGVACKSNLQMQGNMGGSNTTFGEGNQLSTTLDTLYSDYYGTSGSPVSLLKVDCEGVDLDVLQGAETLIRKFKPVIAVEIFPNEINEQRSIKAGIGDYIDFLYKLGYRLDWMDNIFNFIFTSNAAPE